MLRTISRLCLIVIGALFIWRGAAQLVTDFNSIKALFQSGGIAEVFEKFANDPEARKLAISFLKDCLWMLVAATAILCGFFGKSGFWMILFVLVSLFFIGFDIYNKIQIGAFQKDFWGAFKGTLFDFILQICYVIFAIILKIENVKRDNKEEVQVVSIK